MISEVVSFEKIKKDFLKDKRNFYLRKNNLGQEKITERFSEKRFNRVWNIFIEEIDKASKDPDIITLNLFNETKFYLTYSNAEKLLKEEKSLTKIRRLEKKKRLIKNFYKIEKGGEKKNKLLLTLNPTQREDFIDLEDYNEKD
jgi:hypothetical protein